MKVEGRVADGKVPGEREEWLKQCTLLCDTNTDIIELILLRPLLLLLLLLILLLLLLLLLLLF